MVEEQAIVVDSEGEYVWVQAQRQSSCGHCSAKNGCGTQVLSKVLGNKTAHIRCVNTSNLQIGDRVVVGIEESALVSGSLFIYFLPLVSMMFSGGLVVALAKSLGSHYVDFWSILASIAGLIMGLFFARQMTGKNKKNNPYEPVILKKLSSYNDTVKPVLWNK